MKFIRACCALLALAGLGGCATYVTSDVTAFQDWTGSDADRTYAFTESPHQRGIEAHTYEQLVDQGLAPYGFRQVPAANAHYAVSLAYQLVNRTTVVPSLYYDDWSWSGWQMRGPAWGAPGPWWGAPAAYGAEPYPLFEALLRIRFVDRATGREVYDVTARNVSGTPSLVPVMPYLVKSALSGFPLANGSTVRVSLPLELAPSVSSNEVVVTPTPAAPAAAPAAPAAAPSR